MVTQTDLADAESAESCRPVSSSSLLAVDVRKMQKHYLLPQSTGFENNKNSIAPFSYSSDRPRGWIGGGINRLSFSQGL